MRTRETLYRIILSTGLIGFVPVEARCFSQDQTDFIIEKYATKLENGAAEAYKISEILIMLKQQCGKTEINDVVLSGFLESATKNKTIDELDDAKFLAKRALWGLDIKDYLVICHEKMKLFGPKGVMLKNAIKR